MPEPHPDEPKPNPFPYVIMTANGPVRSASFDGINTEPTQIPLPDPREIKAPKKEEKDGSPAD